MAMFFYLAGLIVWQSSHQDTNQTVQTEPDPDRISPSCKVCPLSAISRRLFEILILDIQFQTIIFLMLNAIFPSKRSFLLC